ncbi:MAG TPA: alanine--tRNA ligase [Candidatus Binataceae bacterium]|nr:alanine--tRNA ligase [Candidatus Binataceae bacterium]
MRWTTANIRQSFLDFFKERGHAVVPSFSMVPKGDPTLLFVNAGMVPFKDYFLGLRTPPDKRVVDCQKCLRISGKHNDLEAVGRDTYHHTFFEMLGNWSFGDYYKTEAIAWHWELITKVWGVDPKLLYATVHQDDDEARGIWLKMGVLPPERILSFGDKENFWQMGDTGPCGPCSEIDIDRGAAACHGAAHPGVACAVNVDGCERFIELGNLVFIQYNRDASGVLTPLPMKCVDTGTGLERVAAALQSLETGKLLGNYEIDLFQDVIHAIEEKVVVARPKLPNSPTPIIPAYGSHEWSDISYRAIADHARAVSFLIAEGVLPGNSDREYIVRRLIRRAARHGRYLGVAGPFLADVCYAVRIAMGDAYPELAEHSGRITKAVQEEEARFGETLDRGLELIEQERARLAKSGGKTLSGEVAFKLYDTYGFPLDLTEDVLRSDGIGVDTKTFDRLMDEQRERARAARGAPGVSTDTIAKEIGEILKPAKFVGYGVYETASEVLGAQAGSGGDVRIVVAETPFYPEGGGQTGDRGVIETESGALAEITDTRKADGSIIHVGRLLRGDAREFERGARVKLTVDRARRDATMLNHSATHILHYALRDILGTGVHQAGSLVSPERLRFDFAHQGPVGADRLLTIEENINARIRENAAVTVEEMAYDDALKAGALAFFGDKYGDVVRVVRMGDFSVELCGGTHVTRTGDVGFFKLEAESGVAAGVRRVEAVTGQGALESIRRQEKILDEIAGKLGARDSAAIDRLERILAREKELEKKLRALEQKLASGAGGAAAADETIREVNGVKIVTRRADGVDPRALREMADRMRQKYPSAVIALGSDTGDGKVALLVAVTPDLTARVKAGDIIKQIAPIVGGTGGGRPDLAQAGGRDAAQLDAALGKVAELVR